MPTLQEILETQKQLEASLGTRMANFEKMLQPSSSTVSKVNQNALAQEFTEFRLFAMDMFKLLRTQIETLTIQSDEIDNHTRRNALLFHGVPEKENEDCTSTISNLIQSVMNVKSFQASTIYLCHRLGAKSDRRARPIIVRFTDINVRNTIWNTKRALKSSPAVIGEFLTKTRHDLFYKARNHFGITSCWTSNGVVFIKTPDNTRIKISSASDLESIMSKFPSASISSGSSRVQDQARPKPSHKQASPAVTAPETRKAAKQTK